MKTNCIEKKERSVHFGLFGNGITAYDTSRTDPETNDYLIVAHISVEGNVKLYKEDIEAEDIQRINQQAQSLRIRFIEDWNTYPDEVKFMKMTARLSLTDENDTITWHNILKENLSMGEIVKKYMPYIIFGEGNRPEPEAK